MAGDKQPKPDADVSEEESGNGPTPSGNIAAPESKLGVGHPPPRPGRPSADSEVVTDDDRNLDVTVSALKWGLGLLLGLGLFSTGVDISNQRVIGQMTKELEIRGREQSRHADRIEAMSRDLALATGSARSLTDVEERLRSVEQSLGQLRIYQELLNSQSKGAQSGSP